MVGQSLFSNTNSKEKKCLTIDTREVNELCPGSLELLITTEKNIFFILIEIKATHISHLFNQDGYDLTHLLDFLLLKQILIISSLSIKASTSTSIIQF